jgi:hypothetical protein
MWKKVAAIAVAAAAAFGLASRSDGVAREMACPLFALPSLDGGGDGGGSCELPIDHAIHHTI